MDTELPRAVVAIGGSVEGFAAIAKLIDHLPARTGLAFVVALGPHADGAALAAQLGSAIEAVVIDRPTLVAADRIYLPAHGCDLELVGNELRPQPPLDAPTCSLDRILRTLAEVRGPTAIGVVLSGAGFDGSIGIKLVKERGGMTFAQMPGEQLPDEMPRMAVATGMVDFVLPVAEIARRLAIGPELASPEHDGEDGLRDLLVLVRVRTGHDFTHYKRATLSRRVARRLQITGVASLREYVELARGDARELDAVLRDFMISVTNFFRDPKVFALLEHTVLPALFAKPSTEPLRVWIAGCATGEEAYSYAMLLLELRARLDPGRPLQLFGTDIDAAALAEARLGRYPETIAADVSPARLERFFVREDAFYRIKREVRELVLFAEHNVLRDAPFSRLDVLSCRNLLIYLDRTMQQHVLRTAHFSLAPDRYLVLGSSEHGESDDKLFEPVELEARVFVRCATLTTVLPTQSFRPSWAPLAASARAEPARGERAGELHHRLVERYAPPSVLVNERLEVEHVSLRASRYFQGAAGEPTTDVFQVVLPELRQHLRVAVYEARRTPGVAAIATCQIRLDGEPRSVRLAVRAEPTGGHLLILFEESADRGDAPSVVGAPVDEPVVRQLEDELRHARDQLRTTIEQYETLVEELHASNEELQAINEELRSASEEVEASREETDSVNQELTAVNQELKLRVEEVLAAKSDIANLMESSDVGVIFLDRTLRIYRFTKRSREIFNILESDVGRPLADLTSKVDYAELLRDAAKTLDTLAPVDREVHGTDDRIYQVRMRPYLALDERIAGLVLTFIDITTLRRTEAALRSREALLQDAARRKNEFIATLAHELRNPLTPLKLGLDIQARSANEPATVAAARELMAQQVAQLNRIVDDLLDISRIERGRLELRVEVGLSMRELVVAASAAVKPIVDELHHRLTIEIADDLRVDGDRVRLVQVFVNLLTNAAKYTDPGGAIAVTATCAQRSVETVVADTGIGMAAEVLPRVFDVFVQAEPILTRSRGGLGIGLSLVRQVVELHGGTVAAESPGLGRGSRFVVTLPASEAP